MRHLFGAAGASIASILLLILGNSTSGATMPPAYLPAWLSPLSEILPVGVGIRAIQGLSRFQSDGLPRALMTLPLWVIGAAVVVHLKDVFRRAAPDDSIPPGRSARFRPRNLNPRHRQSR
ncbi:hypothetical protein ACIPPM_20320 [Streptomyces sp. NPDC090119]|uniref:hypothetical protein n=1 Tax=Streptomyces sp. NPDC090119 TaxID=3365951 RepID=UPI00381B3532